PASRTRRAGGFSSRGIGVGRLDRLPLLAIAEMVGAEGRVAARICRPAEADLVPGPGMRIEGLADVLRRHLERALDVQSLPRTAAELPVREHGHDVLARRRRRERERLRAPLQLRGVVEA